MFFIVHVSIDSSTHFPDLLDSQFVLPNSYPYACVTSIDISPVVVRTHDLPREVDTLTTEPFWRRFFVQMNIICLEYESIFSLKIMNH